MLAHALRRLLWTLPALIGVSIITFLFLSYVPDPTDDPAFAARTPPAEIDRMRRERFLDLPRFLNLAPRDVKSRVEAAVQTIDRGGDTADARRELARLGGAALPWAIPRFDALSPENRKDLALALAPIARRMGLAGADEAEDRSRAVGFWTRFWDDRSIEFRRASVRSAVSRLVRYGSRGDDLRELDTFVLDDVLAALEPPDDAVGIARARALIEIAAHVTGRDDRILPDEGRYPGPESVAAARACVDRWQSFWTIYRSDYGAHSGAGRIAAMVLETRYGKWGYEAITHRFGHVAYDGNEALAMGEAPRPSRPPVLDELIARVPLTLAIVLGALALAYTLAVPLGALAAAYRGRRVNVAVNLAVLALSVTPTAAAAVLVRRLFPSAAGSGVLAAIAVLALALLAAPTAQQNASLSLAISQDYVRAAAARGAGRARAVFVHALRNALLPVATLLSMEGPMALGGAFVVERVFSLHGVGEATIVAVQQRDTSWLMAISMIAALIAMLVIVAGDLAVVFIDPRLGPAILARRGRR